MLKYSFIIGLFFYVILQGCNEDSFSMGQELISSTSDVTISDTFTVSTYTIKIDSFQTSGKGYALVGNYTDGNLGTITAKSYFQLGKSSSSLPKFPTYDSIALITHYAQYSYGDTTQPFTLEVHKLSQKLDELPNSSGYICNTKEVAYESDVLGQRTFTPRPHFTGDFPIRLSDVFGKGLFTIIKEASSTYTTADNFYNAYKGFALTSSAGTKSAILRFKANDSIAVLSLRLYYHTETSGYLDFPLRNADYQFNNIKHDFSNSPLNSLKLTSDKLSSNKTDGLSYSQPGTGIMTRIEFPNIRQILNTGKNIQILSARLYISPIEDKNPLPSSFYLYSTDVANNMGSALSNTSTGTITPTLYTDPFHINTAYSIDVTSFISSAVSTISDNPPALILSKSSTESSLFERSIEASLERLIIASPNRTINPTRLKVTYWRY